MALFCRVIRGNSEFLALKFGKMAENLNNDEPGNSMPYEVYLGGRSIESDNSIDTSTSGSIFVQNWYGTIQRANVDRWLPCYQLCDGQIVMGSGGP